MAARRRNNRSLRRLLIYPKFQLLLIGVNIFVILLTMLIFWSSTESVISDLAPAAGLSGIAVDYYKQYLAYQTYEFHRALIVSFIIGTAISGGLTLIISHRISGPLVRMRNFFIALRDHDGPVPPLEFRDGDYLLDFPPLVNAAIDKVKKI